MERRSSESDWLREGGAASSALASLAPTGWGRLFAVIAVCVCFVLQARSCRGSPSWRALLSNQRCRDDCHGGVSLVGWLVGYDRVYSIARGAMLRIGRRKWRVS